MKIRTGFVSNSSSSSFVVATRSKQPTYDEIRDALGIIKGSPAEKIFGSLITFMTEGNKINKIELYDESPVLGKLYSEGWNLFKVHVSNQECDVASYFFYENENIAAVNTPTLKVITHY